MQDRPRPDPAKPNEEPRTKTSFLADWWIYAFMAIFIGGLIFLTYALTLRGEVINDFGKRSALTAPAHAADAPTTCAA